MKKSRQSLSFPKVDLMRPILILIICVFTLKQFPQKSLDDSILLNFPKFLLRDKYLELLQEENFYQTKEETEQNLGVKNETIELWNQANNQKGKFWLVQAATKIAFPNHSDPDYTDVCYEVTREMCDFCCLVDFEFCSRDIGIASQSPTGI